MHLTEAAIKAARLAKLQQVNAGPTTSTPVVHGALVSGQSSTTTVPIVIPKPPKAIFSIVSWNVQDYKGRKITEGKGWVHAFIKRLVEALEVDLLLLIETDVDLGEAAARIELADHGNFGSELPTARCDFHLVGSERAFKKVELPQTFTLGDIQNDKLKRTEDFDWLEEIEALFTTYQVTYKGNPVDYPTLKGLAGKSNFSPADAEFERSDDCPACDGGGCVCRGKKTCVWCTCKHCKQKRVRTVFCRACTCRTCHEKRILREACMFCGSKNPQCLQCGGKKLERWCPTCHCVACDGEGTVTVAQPQPCIACAGTGHQPVTCPQCQGGGGGFAACPDCSGPTSMQLENCQRCGDQRRIAVTCPGCNGQRRVPGPCTACNSAGTITVQTVVDCTHCGGNGYLARLPPGQTCTVCSGTGRQRVRCGKCIGARCPTCLGAGEPSADAWVFAVETASDLLQTKVFDGYDVETYAALWRTPPARIPSKFGLGHEACDRKLAWLCTGSSLRSTDPAGKELGYQDLSGDLNGRSPIVLPLWLSLDDKPVQLPFAALHALWDVSEPKLKGATPPKTKTKTTAPPKKKKRSKTELEKLRGISVEKMLELAVGYPGAALASLGGFDNPLLVGDFNLHYDPTKNTAATRAFADFTKKGYRTTTSGTKTSLTTLKSGLGKLGKSAASAQLYSMAYDHFLVKTGSDLDTHVVQAGVIDILDLAKRLIAADPVLAGQIDTDAAATARIGSNGKSKDKPSFDLKTTKDPDLARAFYLYRNYVSDHVPVLIDILVDTQNAQQAALRDRMIEHGHQLGLLIEKQQEKAQKEPLVPSYAGHWTESKLVFAGTPSLEVQPGGQTVKLTGQITRWRAHSLTVRVAQRDKQDKDTGFYLDFHGTHTIEPDVLKDWKVVGLAWMTGIFTITRTPETLDQTPTVGVAEPPAFWRPK